MNISIKVTTSTNIIYLIKHPYLNNSIENINKQHLTKHKDKHKLENIIQRLLSK